MTPSNLECSFVNNNHTTVSGVDSSTSESIQRVIKSQSTLFEMMESISIGILLIHDHKIIYANNIIEHLLNISSKKLISSKLTKYLLTQGNDISQYNSFYENIRNLGEGKIKLILKKSNSLPISTTIKGKIFLDKELSDVYILMVQDNSSILELQNDLNESEDRLQKILETTIEGIFILESPNSLTYANQSGSDLFGYTQFEMSKLLPSILFGSKRNTAIFKKAFEIISQGSDFKGDAKMLSKNKEVIYVEIYGTSIVLKGKLLYYFSLRNITQRILNQLSLRLSETKFRTVTENIPNLIVRISSNLQIIYANHAFLNLYQISINKIMRSDIRKNQILPIEFVDELNSMCISKTKQPQSITVEIPQNDDLRFFEWTIIPEVNELGKIGSFLCAGHDITNQKKTEQNLIIAKEKAEDANRLKSAFLANMSHEIRTPLNAIVGFSSLLDDNTTTSDERAGFAQTIRQNSENLLSIISSIIDLSKLDADQLLIQNKAFAIDKLMTDLFQQFSALKRTGHLSPDVAFFLDASNPISTTIHSDYVRVRQIIENILKNAFKFTFTGEIHLGYFISNNSILNIYVSDTGIGIEKEKFEVIFEPFRQLDQTFSRNFGGTGMGLTLCKKLIEKLGGQICLVSNPKKGSTFTICLPIKTNK